MKDSKRFNAQSIPNGSHGETGDDRIRSGSFEVCKNNSASNIPHPLTSHLMDHPDGRCYKPKETAVVPSRLARWCERLGL